LDTNEHVYVIIEKIIEVSLQSKNCKTYSGRFQSDEFVSQNIYFLNCSLFVKIYVSITENFTFELVHQCLWTVTQWRDVFIFHPTFL